MENKTEENGIHLHFIEPAYTSQTCSFCGYVDKTSRDGEIYKCQHCGIVIDADYNASINILHKGVIVPLTNKTKKIKIISFFFIFCNYQEMIANK